MAENDEVRAAAQEIVNTVSAPRIEDAFDAPLVAVPRNAWLSALAVACAYLAHKPITRERVAAAVEHLG